MPVRKGDADIVACLGELDRHVEVVLFDACWVRKKKKKKGRGKQGEGIAWGQQLRSRSSRKEPGGQSGSSDVGKSNA